MLCGVVLIAWGAAGCGGADSGAPGFTVHNDSGKQLGHLVITDAGPVLNFANLEHGEQLTRDIPRATELPKTINVYWEDHNGRHQHQRVEVWKRIPSTYAGTVKLTVNRNGMIKVSKA